MPEKPKAPKAKSRLTDEHLALLRDLRRGVEGIRDARNQARAEGRPVLFETVDDIPMGAAQRLFLPYERAKNLAVDEILRRVDQRKELGAVAGKRRAIPEEQKAGWVAAAAKIRKRNPHLSMTAVSNAVGKAFGCTGRTVRKHLAKFWERS